MLRDFRMLLSCAAFLFVTHMAKRPKALLTNYLAYKLAFCIQFLPHFSKNNES